MAPYSMGATDKVLFNDYLNPFVQPSWSLQSGRSVYSGADQSGEALGRISKGPQAVLSVRRQNTVAEDPTAQAM
jgi:hypothetical protein